MLTISKKQAGVFMLMKQGLYGEYKYIGKEGISDFIREAGCIQYDPIDICGKNHELVLQSRIAGFQRTHLYNLLYKERKLFDWLDKNMSITLVGDWPYLDSYRDYYKNGGREKKEIDNIAEELIEYIKTNGPVCSKDINYNEKINWFWAPASLSRAALDTLYYRGDLIIHHKKNTRKYYDITSRHIDENLINSLNPNKTEEERHSWYVHRRIKSVGLLWNKSSDAWLGIRGLKTAQREKAFENLLSKNLVSSVSVEGIKEPMYFSSDDSGIMSKAISDNAGSDRLEFLAPLDNMLWDRKLIKSIFEFEYKWEIYTPKLERKFGYYVLPILYRNNLVGRIEIIKNKSCKKLEIKNMWLENSTRETKKLHEAIETSLKRLNVFYWDSSKDSA